MKRLGVGATAWVILASMATGCVCYDRPPRREVVVESGPAPAEVYVEGEPPAPPPPQNEVIIGVAPSPEHIWLAGHWRWDGARYVWWPGRWERRHHRGATWIGGHWDRRGGRSFWVEGHWN